MNIGRSIDIGAGINTPVRPLRVIDEPTVTGRMIGNFIEWLFHDSAFSVAPVFGFLAVMRHCNNFDDIAFDAIY